MSSKPVVLHHLASCEMQILSQHFWASAFPTAQVCWCCWSLEGTSVQFSRSVVSNSSWPHESQHARPPCPSPSPGVHSNLCPSSRWCHPAISSSVVPFSLLQSFPASGSFPMSQFFTSGGQIIGVSAPVLPMNIQDWFPLGLTGLISLQIKVSWSRGELEKNFQMWDRMRGK